MKFKIKRLSENLVAYEGLNFSGRSQAVSEAVQTGKGVMLGGSVYSAVSGLHDTIKGELQFYCEGDDNKFKKIIDLATGFGLDKILLHNPFAGQCSGGQEAIIAILCRLALGRNIIGLDICVEQLSMEARRFLYDSVIPKFPKTQVLLVDNRLSELFPDHKEEYPITSIQSDLRKENGTIASLSNGQLLMHNISFGYYKGQNLFNNFSVSFDSGIHLLAGANGSGKSTLAKILAGLLCPRSGNFEYNSKTITPYRHPGKYISYAFQDPNLQLFATSVSGVLSDEELNLMDDFGLNHFVGKHPLDLPWVLRKRLSIVKALERVTPVVILDEPTLGQDNLFCRMLAKKLITYSKRGRIIIVISHSPYFAETINARVIEMSKLKV